VAQRRSFKILETLGRGGFGTVYRAEMTDAGGFSKQVALKVMSYQGEAADGIARRMRDEARVLGLLRHRAIVGVNSLVLLEEGWGVVMEFVEGVDLSTTIKAGRVPVGAALEMLEEVAGALEAAYRARPTEGAEPLKLVHRDIKPSNIRITRQAEVKLLDFGVAQAEFITRESEDEREFVMGSARYMAPERRRGTETHQGDVYALGLVLANLLTRKRFPDPPGTAPEHARFLSTVLETVRRTIADDDAPEVRESEQQIKTLLLEMLAYEPSDRPDAGTVERRLRRLRSTLPPPLLRDWADRTIPRLLAATRDESPDRTRGDTGRIMVERGGKGAATPGTTGPEPDSPSRLSPAPDRAPTGPAAPPQRPASRRAIALAFAAGLLVGVGIAVPILLFVLPARG
jgi:serine/threonine protein kinase